MKNYIFVRHGQSQANLDNEYAWHSMTPLTVFGREQAQKTWELLKNKNITTIVSSDLNRALSTAQIIADTIWFDRNNIIITSLLREIDAGEFSWTPHAPKLSVLDVGVESIKWESLRDIQIRAHQCISFLKNIKGTWDILVVWHNSFYSCLFSTLEWEDDLLKYRKSWHMDNASVKETEL